MNSDLLHEIEILIKSKYRLIFLNTNEENRAESLLKLLADYMNLPFFTWTATKGLRRSGPEFKNGIYDTAKPGVALDHITTTDLFALYHFRGFGEFIKDPQIKAKLHEVVTGLIKKDSAIIITGFNLDIPDSLKTESARLDMPPPSEAEYRTLLNQIIRDLRFKGNLEVEMTGDQITQLINNIKGLTITEAEKILTKVMVTDNKLTEKDIREIIKAKKEIIEKHGVLEYYPVEQSMDEIAGLDNLKSWLSKRRNIISKPQEAKEFGLEFPKGILLLGVPGCGKSLCAKVVAMEWNLPLLKFDTANLYNKYIGETEKNLKKAITTAEKMSPVILWIDEIEKAFSSVTSDHDGGVSTRIFGTFLTWMQDRNGDVFIFATANDVSKLPPEFLRKGRFDEIFFVDLPNEESRKLIFEIHLQKRGKNPKNFDIKKLADLSPGFTGAEIEQVIVSGLYSAFSENLDLTTEVIVNEIKNTKPLSTTMSGRINYLRDWAKERTVSAN